jgi:uncharacterized membrane protein
MKSKSLRRIVIAALLTAFCCVATMLIQIRTPMNGYLNMGDCFVLLSAWSLGGIWGAAAAGVGSALADLFSGYVTFVPGTFVIKALMAIVAVALYKLLTKVRLPKIAAYVISAVAAEVVMVLGYFVYEALFIGEGMAALGGIPWNIVQGVFGIITGTVIILLISKIKPVQAFIDESFNK